MDFSRGSYSRDALFGRNAFSIVVLATATSASIVDTTLNGNYAIAVAECSAASDANPVINGNAIFISIGIAKSNTHTELNPVAIFSTIVLSASVSSTDIIAVHYRIIEFTYAGNVAQGETICVDGEKYLVTLDGANVMSGFTGEFPKFTPGSNIIFMWLASTDYTIYITKRDRTV